MQDSRVVQDAAELNQAVESTDLLPVLHADRGADFITIVNDTSEALGPMRIYFGKPRRRGRVRLSPRSLTGAAVFLAGQKRRAEVAQEWRGHLLGEPGHSLTQQQQVRAARGFLRTAMILRYRDAADLAWRPADAVLRSRTKSNLFVLIPTVAAALFIFRHEGTLGVLTSAEAIDAIVIGLYGLIRVGRWYRKVKPPEPRAWSTWG